MLYRSVFIGLAAVALAGTAQAAAPRSTPPGAVRVASNVSLPPPSSFIAGSPLEVVVENVRAARGHVHIDVCSEETFLNKDEDCVYSANVPATEGVTSVTLPRIPPGKYAIQAFLDENDNGHVDRNRLGIPKEQVGFSRDPMLLTGAPRFKAVAFDHSLAGGSIHLKLKSFP